MYLFYIYSIKRYILFIDILIFDRRTTMPRSDSLKVGELTDTSYYILLSLVDANHGYMIMKTIEEMTNNQFSIGSASMYTTIKKLLNAELITLCDEVNKKKIYLATEKGIELLGKEVQRRKKMIKYAEKILKQKRVL